MINCVKGITAHAINVGLITSSCQLNFVIFISSVICLGYFVIIMTIVSVVIGGHVRLISESMGGHYWI